MAGANKTSLVEYMSLQYSTIQSVRCHQEDGGGASSPPHFLELVHAHETWGAKMRVDLIWRHPPLTPLPSSLTAKAGGRRPVPARATPPPRLRPEEEEGDEELVTIIKSPLSKDLLGTKLKHRARQLIEVEEGCWSGKERFPN